MSTKIRPEIAVKNKYYISKHRYYELKHFCMQYPEWKHELSSIDGISSRSTGTSEHVNNGRVSKPTEIYAEARMFYEQRIQMVEDAATRATDDIFGKVLVMAVTNEISYEQMAARGLVHCGKDLWYAAYRRFFWILDKARK